jgi:hypothetical protein
MFFVFVLFNRENEFFLNIKMKKIRNNQCVRKKIFVQYGKRRHAQKIIFCVCVFNEIEKVFIFVSSTFIFVSYLFARDAMTQLLHSQILTPFNNFHFFLHHHFVIITGRN